MNDWSRVKPTSDEWSQAVEELIAAKNAGIEVINDKVWVRSVAQKLAWQRVRPCFHCGPDGLYWRDGNHEVGGRLVEHDDPDGNTGFKCTHDEPTQLVFEWDTNL